MAVHVSIHDVSPAWEREVESALELAHSYGVRPALLVVPDYHGRAPLLEAPDYCRRLRDLAAEGHEIFLHGYFHRARPWREHAEAAHRARGEGASLRERARYLYAQRVVSGGEAEFADVTEREASARLDEGERVLREAGLEARGFVPPAWSAPAWFGEVLARRGYRFTEDHLRVYDPAGGTSRASVVLNYASRTPARLLSSVAYCRAARGARRLLPARIAIHPADMRVLLLRRELTKLLAWARGDVVACGRELLS